LLDKFDMKAMQQKAECGSGHLHAHIFRQLSASQDAPLEAAAMPHPARPMEGHKKAKGCPLRKETDAPSGRTKRPMKLPEAKTAKMELPWTETAKRKRHKKK